MRHEPMDYDRFVTIVEQSAGIGRERAVNAVRATLETLGERISAGEARDLADQLPAPAAAWITSAGGAEAFDVDEFLRRVAEREGVDLLTAQQHARAVFDALQRAVDAEELADMSAELPQDYRPLLPRGPRVEVLATDAFLQRVADRAAVDETRAREITNAVLETLAERIAGGEVRDLIARLPVELHPPLKRGDEASGGKAQRMNLDAFLDRIAEREGVSVDDAGDHARAVLLTLREAVGDKEFFDVLAELPQDYKTALVS